MKKLFIILITLFITVNITQAQLCDTGYPNCEACKGSNGNCVPWGPIEVKSFPMVAIPNMQLPCSPQPGCVMKVAIKKRNCNGRIQMKVCGMKMEGCTANSCKCKDFFKTNPTAFLWYAYGPPFMNNAFGLFQNVPFDFVDVDIFSYTCYGIYDVSTSGCANLWIIPCKEYACCKYSLRVKGTTNCGTTGFVSEWLDASKKYYNYSDGSGDCDVCKHGSNHEPSKPCDDGNPATEGGQILTALGWPSSQDNPFEKKNKVSGENTCVYSCHDLDTFFKTWYMSNGQIYKSKNSKRKPRFPNN